MSELNDKERFLVEHAWGCAENYDTSEAFRQFLLGFHRPDDSEAFKAALLALVEDYEQFYL